MLFRGLDQKTGSQTSGVIATKMGSLEVGVIFVDECIEVLEGEWDMLLGRVRQTVLPSGNKLPFRQIFGATNPGAPSHWIYRRGFIDNKIRMISSNTLENTFLPQDYIDNLNELTGIEYDRYVMGKWVGAEGLVYGDVFNPDIHVVERFDIPDFWEKYRVVDFGYTNPFVCQWWARRPKEKHDVEVRPWYRYREIYMSQRIVEHHAADILGYTEKINFTIADHDAEDRATLAYHGVPTLPAFKEIIPGIQEVRRLLRREEMFFMEDSLVEVDKKLKDDNLPTCTEEEFPVFVWGVAGNSSNVKEIPVDKNDHGMDTTRYVAWHFAPARRSRGVSKAGIATGDIPNWQIDAPSVRREGQRSRWGVHASSRDSGWRRWK